MKKILDKTVWLCDSVNEWVGRKVAWLSLALVLFVCFNVVSREFNMSDAWRGELEWHLFAALFLLGAGYTFKHDKHVRVDLFYANYSKRDKAWTNLIGGLVFLVPWCVIVLIYSWDFAMGSFEIRENSPNPNGLPFRFIIKFVIVIGAALLLLQALSSIAKSLSTIFYTQPESEA